MGRASKPSAAVESGPFGPGIQNEHRVVGGGQGIPADANASKPMEAGYVPPEERSNPEYLEKLAKEKTEREKSEGMKKAFGIGVMPMLIGASPNSPQGKAHLLY